LAILLVPLLSFSNSNFNASKLNNVQGIHFNITLVSKVNQTFNNYSLFFTGQAKSIQILDEQTWYKLRLNEIPELYYTLENFQNITTKPFADDSWQISDLSKQNLVDVLLQYASNPQRDKLLLIMESKFIRPFGDNRPNVEVLDFYDMQD